MEDMNTMPFSAEWNSYCEKHEVPINGKWIEEVRDYEKDVLSKRS